MQKKKTDWNRRLHEANNSDGNDGDGSGGGGGYNGTLRTNDNSQQTAFEWNANGRERIVSILIANKFIDLNLHIFAITHTNTERKFQYTIVLTAHALSENECGKFFSLFIFWE